MKKNVITISIFSVFLGISTAQADIVWTEGYHHYGPLDSHEHVDIYNDVRLDIEGGSVGYLRAFNNTLINFNSGVVNYLTSGGNNVTNINGGNGIFLNAYENSVINLHYLNSLNSFDSYENGILNLYAYDVQYIPYESIPGRGDLTGTYIINHQRFIFGISELDLSHINIVPELSTLFLLGFGCLFLRRKK